MKEKLIKIWYFLKKYFFKISGLIILTYGLLSSGRSLWLEFIKPNLFLNSFFNLKIENIKPGYNNTFIEKEIGLSPILVNKLVNFTFEDENNEHYYIDGFTERIYIQKDKYYIQTISDQTDKVIFYSIVSLDKNFYPSLPLEFLKGNEYNLKQRLGLFKFSELPEPDQGKIVSPNQHNFYTEVFYFGRPGGYKYYFSGISPYGITYHGNQSNNFNLIGNAFKDYSTYKNTQEYKDFRATEIPNAFGIMSTKDLNVEMALLKYLLENGLGPNTSVIYDITQ